MTVVALLGTGVIILELRRCRTQSSNAAETPIVHYRVLSRKAIWGAAVIIALAGSVVVVWLLTSYGRGGDLQASRNSLDAIRTAGTILLGTGGAAALLLAARRQQSTEIALRQKDRDQEHQERVARVSEGDATERRITELYTRAVEQLGQNRAVRLGGLYALERLAQDYPEQRQMIVNVICAYLRMPYILPDSRPVGDADKETQVKYLDREQERQVRLAAQRILSDHLLHSSERFWSDVDIDLTGAILINLSFLGCRIRSAHFDGAWFIGSARFDRTIFDGETRFRAAIFADNASFDRVSFRGPVIFDAAEFAEGAPAEIQRL